MDRRDFILGAVGSAVSFYTGGLTTPTLISPDDFVNACCDYAEWIKHKVYPGNEYASLCYIYPEGKLNCWYGYFNNHNSRLLPNHLIPAGFDKLFHPLFSKLDVVWGLASVRYSKYIDYPVVSIALDIPIDGKTHSRLNKLSDENESDVKQVENMFKQLRQLRKLGLTLQGCKWDISYAPEHSCTVFQCYVSRYLPI